MILFCFVLFAIKFSIAGSAPKPGPRDVCKRLGGRGMVVVHERAGGVCLGQHQRDARDESTSQREV